MKIEPPTKCPSCLSDLEWSNNQLFCKNSSCKSQTDKKIRHFVLTLKIKGFGPATISKLQLNNILEIYTLTKEEITIALSSEKLAEKLFYEIQNSKKATLNSLLPAFSIPLIGKSASEKLSTVCDSIYDINEQTCRSAGLGPKATTNLLNWKTIKFPQIEELPFSFTFKRLQQIVGVQGILCISGKLKTFKTKAEATKVLNAKGYIVRNSITKDVTILVNESGIKSAKTTKARNSGITIVTNLKDFLENKK